MTGDDLTHAVRDAYGTSAASWSGVPERLYRRLGDALVAAAPDGALRGALVLDVGAGTGAVSRAALAAGARAVVGTDLAFGMVQHDAASRGARAVADARALPFRDQAFDAVVAGCVINHLAVPGDAVREMVRVTRHGGDVLASSFREGPQHPVKAIVDESLARYGFTTPDWHVALKEEREPLTATAAALRAVARSAGCTEFDVVECAVDSGLRTAEELVDLRLGMASSAPFFERLDAASQADARSGAIAALGPAPEPFVPVLLVLVVHVV